MHRTASMRWGASVLLPLFLPILAAAAPAARQTVPADEIPIERCDVLPVVTVRIDSANMRFLLDTGATTVLNINSFSSGRSREIQVSSWKGTTATSAKEVSLPDFALGSHHLRDLKLPAIDLSPIGGACGGKIDGILGVDLLDKMGVTIDLQRRVARLGEPHADPKAAYEVMEKSMQHCTDAFEQGRAAELADCFSSDIVLYAPYGEFRGRSQVMSFLQARYLRHAPRLKYRVTVRDVKLFGDALWYSYDYSIDCAGEHAAGHGMSMCRKENGRWRILNLHNSLLDDPAAPPRSPQPLADATPQ